VVGLSVIRVQLVYLALATVGAVIALLLATMPKLRPWRSTGKRAAGTRSRHRIRATPVRSMEPVTATTSQAAAFRGPVPNGMPPVLSAPPAAPVAWPPAAPARTAPPAAPPAGSAGPATAPVTSPAASPLTSPAPPPAPPPSGFAPPRSAAAPLPSRHARNAGATRP
jgi:hypothetical protein